MKIAVIGLGYVGLSNAMLLALHNEVVAVDISEQRVAMVNARRSPIEDAELEDYLANKPLSLSANTDLEAAVEGAAFVIVATPTDYDPQHNYFIRPRSIR
jgi:UDPglucose 6-dehydrogenase